MKKTRKLLVAALVLSLIVSAFVPGVSAHAESTQRLYTDQWYSIQIGSTDNPDFMDHDRTTPEEIVPGMMLATAGNNFWLIGMPNKPGTYCGWVTIPLVNAEGEVIECPQFYFDFIVMSPGIVPQPEPEPTPEPTPVPTPAPTPTPQPFQITKHPTGEWLYEGGSCSFVTYGTSYSYMTWYLISPYGEWLSIYDLYSRFPYMSVNASDETWLRLYNVPLSLNGYRVITVLTDRWGNRIQTDGNCYIWVDPVPAPEPTPSPTPAPTPAPAAPADKVDMTGIDKNNMPDSMKNAEGKYQIAFIAGSGDIYTNPFISGVYSGIKQEAYLEGRSYNYYTLPEGEENVYVLIMTAIAKGAKVVIGAGSENQAAFNKAAREFSDVDFIIIDGSAEGAPNNLAAICFSEEQSGYLAGYAAVKEGYTRLGFVGGGGGANEHVNGYAYGFAQGADSAATELGKDIELKYSYLYGGAYSATPELFAMASDWYQTGTELIFSCGGSMFNSVASAAVLNGGKVIGVDVDQSYQSPVVLTSAVKELSGTTEWAVGLAFNGCWNDIGGKTVTVGADRKAVGLPVDSWRMTRFTVSDYEKLLKKMVDGELKVDASVSTPEELAKQIFPKTKLINVDKYTGPSMEELVKMNTMSADGMELIMFPEAKEAFDKAMAGLTGVN